MPNSVSGRLKTVVASRWANAVAGASLPRPVTQSGEDGDASVLLGDVVDELHDQEGLASPGGTEEAGLAALGVGLEEVDHLDPRLEHLDIRGLLFEGRRRAVDRIGLLRVDRGALVHGLADDVQDAAQRLTAHRDRDRAARVLDPHASREARGRGHRDCPHLALAHVLRHLQHEPLRVGEDVLHLDALHLDRVVNPGQLSRLELDVHHGPDDLDDLPDVHASAPCLRASPPPTMSSSSLLSFPCRAWLYWMARPSIVSFAFFVAASIAVILAPSSPASDSMRARKTWVRTWRGSRSPRIASGDGS